MTASSLRRPTAGKASPSTARRCAPPPPISSLRAFRRRWVFPASSRA